MNSPKGRSNRPNILFILSDDQGWGDLGCYGHPRLKTPNLDRLAEESCRLTDCYVSSPVCSPTRAAFLTGRNPNRYGMKHIVNNGFENPDIPWPRYHHLPLEEPMLPRLLQQAGYRTIHVGKWHISLMGRAGEPGPREYGYDDYLVNRSGEQYRVKDPGRFLRNDITLDKTEAKWTDELYVDEAIRFIDQAGSQPFFLHYNSHTPHTPEECAERYQKLYPNLTREEQIYYGCITQMDDQLGLLFQHLHRRGLAENTVVVFISDNGPIHPIFGAKRAEENHWFNCGSTGPFRGGKLIIYEGGIRVPAIIRWPGLSEAGSVNEIPVSIEDFLPTFCAVAGAPLPTGIPFDGGDMRPALTGKTIERPHPLYWQFDQAQAKFHRYGDELYESPSLALREDRWKLMCNKGFVDPELYNLDYDPGERWNLAEFHPEIVHDLTEKMRPVYEDVNGPYSKTAKYLNPNLKHDYRPEEE